MRSGATQCESRSIRKFTDIKSSWPSFPSEVRVHVAQNTTQDVWNIKSILNIIQKEIDVREISKKVKAMATTTSTEEFNNGYLSSGNKPPLQMPTFVY